MSLFNLSDIIGTLKDGVSKALKVKGEVELTGSNVKELASRKNFTVTAGSRTSTIASLTIPTSDFSVLIRGDSAHSFSVDIDWLITGGTFSGTIYGQTKILENTSGPWAGKRFETIGNRATIFIRNNDTVDHSYDIVINGIGIGRE